MKMVEEKKGEFEEKQRITSLLKQKMDEKIINDKQKGLIYYLFTKIQNPVERARLIQDLSQITKENIHNFIDRLKEAAESSQPQQPTQSPQLQLEIIEKNLIDNKEFLEKLKAIAIEYGLDIAFYRVGATKNGVSIPVRFFKINNNKKQTKKD